MTPAASPLQSAILAGAVRAAILRADDAFEQLAAELKDAYTRAWDAQTRKAIIAALDALRDLGPGASTPEDAAAIMGALKTAIGPDAMSGVLHEPVIRLSDALWRLGPKEVGAATGVDIGFMAPDLEALRLVQDANLYWVGQNYNSWTDGLFRGALTDYFRDGMTRQQLAQRFADDFAGLSDRGIHYWELLADHTATKTREIGRVTGYERAAVATVQVRAHLDDHTTEICRAMHGKIIPVTALRSQVDRYLGAVSRRDTEGAKEAWTMHPDASALDESPGADLPDGTAGPPYHFRCRTITVVYLGES